MKTGVNAGRGQKSFTLIEMLAVMAVIVILASIVLGLASFMQSKAAQSRAQSEVAAMESACESYKTDNGAYPVISGSTPWSSLTSNGGGDPTSTYYQSASLDLYKALTGDSNASGIASSSYFPINPNMCQRSNMSAAISSTNPVLYLIDPWGNSYGYSTTGNNPTFDLWSTAGTVTTGSASPGATIKWVKNW